MDANTSMTNYDDQMEVDNSITNANVLQWYEMKELDTRNDDQLMDELCFLFDSIAI